jgi:hypothetical protein
MAKVFISLASETTKHLDANLSSQRSIAQGNAMTATGSKYQPSNLQLDIQQFGTWASDGLPNDEANYPTDITPDYDEDHKQYSIDRYQKETLNGGPWSSVARRHK